MQEIQALVGEICSRLRKIGVFTQVRRETGREYGVQVPYDEGIANHIGPKPCAGIREGVGEASVGVRQASHGAAIENWSRVPTLSV